MKPIYLSLEGINSFTDKQEVFFDRLAETGLFCICGATGSGKTTILDSIVLALYGKGGRGRLSDYINLSLNSACVEFEFVSENTVFRVERRFFRDANKPSKCILTDKTARKIIADQVSAADSKLREIIGLAREEFTQVALIEQGQFSEFLCAEKGTRNATVGNLFRLDKYKNLYGKFNAKMAVLNERAVNLEKQLNECVQLNDADVATLCEALETAKEEKNKCILLLKECCAEVDKQRAQKQEWDNILKARQNQVAMEQKLKEQACEIEALEDKLKKIDVYKDDAVAKRISIERDKQLFGELEGLKNTYALKKASEGKSKKLAEAIIAAELSLEKNKSKLSKLQSEANSLIADCEAGIEDAKNIYEFDAEFFLSNLFALKVEMRQIVSESYDGGGDTQSRLCYVKGDIRMAILELSQKIHNVQSERVRLLGEIKTNKNGLLDAEKEMAAGEHLHILSLKESNRLKDEASSLQREIALKKEKLKVAQLGDSALHLRENLKTGDECPVCGGKFQNCESKAAESNTQLIEADLAEIEAKLEEVRKNRLSAETALSVAATKSEAARMKSEHFRTLILLLENSLLRIDNGILDADALPKLTTKLEYISGAAAKSDLIYEEMTMLTQEVRVFKANLLRFKEELAICESETKEMTGIIDSKTGGRDLFEVQSALEKKIAADTDFVARFDKSREETEVRIRAMNNIKAGLLGELKSIKETSEKNMQFDADSFILLEQRKSELEESRAELERKCIKNEFEIKTAQAGLEKKKELESLMNENTDKTDKLSLILKLIKGDKFLEYVAEEYILRFTASASNILAKISSGKYTLEYQDGIFYVRDFLMAGELRRAATLSGGETFLASLSLAMAITEEISSYKSFEFFFLDEGFGTLDANSIDIVYDALETLSKETLVGIVTHRSELVDKIQSRILVSAATEGRGSAISL